MVKSLGVSMQTIHHNMGLVSKGLSRYWAAGKCSYTGFVRVGNAGEGLQGADSFLDLEIVDKDISHSVRSRFPHLLGCTTLRVPEVAGVQVNFLPSHLAAASASLGDPDNSRVLCDEHKQLLFLGKAESCFATALGLK